MTRGTLRMLKRARVERALPACRGSFSMYGYKTNV